MPTRIGLMGGTFDPIHYGHLVAGEQARHACKLDQVLFIPCGAPPHKPEGTVASAEHRLQMVRLAVADNQAFTCSDVEVRRPGRSYAVDTLQALRKSCDSPTDFYFILGADAALEMLTWRDPDELLRHCQFVAVTRPGHDLSLLPSRIGNERAAQMLTVAIPGVDVSSTEIRRRVAAKLPIRYLTPQPVVDYIAHHGLYANEVTAPELQHTLHPSCR